MRRQDIEAIMSQYWKPGWGSISADEAAYMQELIARFKPQCFLEIGMASGLSTGMIANFLEENGGTKLVSLDHDDTFFGDTSKPNGFLIPDIYPAGSVSIVLRKFKTALDVHRFDEKYHMVFIDANHQHPWPTIDTLCIYPFLEGSKTIIHHDLRLFRKQKILFGIGPKYLFDQFPEAHRNRSLANEGNIFSINLDMPKEDLIAIAADAFALPWSLRTPMQKVYLEKFDNILSKYYGENLRQHFAECTAKFNVLDRFRSGL